MKFDGPIPGQSLTGTPRNNPWERPPETADPEEAIEKHIQRFSNPKVMDGVLTYVEAGIPVSMVTEMVLTGAVANGIHSIDMSMMIAPVVHEYIVELLESEGVEFKEFFDEDDDEDIRKQMATSQAISGIKEKPTDDDDMEAMEDEGSEEEESDDMEEEEMPKRGLMARPQGDME